jgi:hypothetical protein
MAKRRQPHNPAAAAQAALERKEREAERQRLEGQGATVKVDSAGRIISAFRSNVFNLLLSRGTITPNQHDAAHTLCLAWARWKGLDGRPEAAGLVQGGEGCREIVTDRMIRGGREVEAALSSVETLSRIILEQFAIATVEEDRPMQWRGVMERIGIKSRDKQVTAVIAALEQLRVYYQEPGRVAA